MLDPKPSALTAPICEPHPGQPHGGRAGHPAAGHGQRHILECSSGSRGRSLSSARLGEFICYALTNRKINVISAHLWLTRANSGCELLGFVQQATPRQVLVQRSWLKRLDQSDQLPSRGNQAHLIEKHTRACTLGVKLKSNPAMTFDLVAENSS